MNHRDVEFGIMNLLRKPIDHKPIRTDWSVRPVAKGSPQDNHGQSIGRITLVLVTIE